MDQRFIGLPARAALAEVVRPSHLIERMDAALAWWDCFVYQASVETRVYKNLKPGEKEHIKKMECAKLGEFLWQARVIQHQSEDLRDKWGDPRKDAEFQKIISSIQVIRRSF